MLQVEFIVSGLHRPAGDERGGSRAGLQGSLSGVGWQKRDFAGSGFDCRLRTDVAPVGPACMTICSWARACCVLGPAKPAPLRPPPKKKNKKIKNQKIKK